MSAQKGRNEGSRELALRLYGEWVRRRQDRPGFRVPEDEKELAGLGLSNFEVQLAGPRRQHLEELKRLGDELSTADRVALLVALELPALEISTLLHRMSAQLAQDSEATYFSPENQFSDCGCGCGCCCAAMEGLANVERVNTHMDAKPFAIDPFNESGLSLEDRDGLLIRDFLDSYEALSAGVAEEVNQPYFDVGRESG